MRRDALGIDGQRQPTRFPNRFVDDAGKSGTELALIIIRFTTGKQDILRGVTVQIGNANWKGKKTDVSYFSLRRTRNNVGDSLCDWTLPLRFWPHARTHANCTRDGRLLKMIRTFVFLCATKGWKLRAVTCDLVYFLCRDDISNFFLFTVLSLEKMFWNLCVWI